MAFVLLAETFIMKLFLLVSIDAAKNTFGKSKLFCTFVHPKCTNPK
jgi:hypothetical protein